MITHGGLNMGMEFEHGESSGQKLEGNIINVTLPSPKFDVPSVSNFL
jgi:hypothetical protein